jgi:molybdopterin molybdotransferase
MVFVPPLRFEQARRVVLDTVLARRSKRAVERVSVAECSGRVLSVDIVSDRDYPPLPRSIRDGFAVRAADFPGRVAVVGEVRAGQSPAGPVRPGQAVEIMTGAGVPEGADAVIMVEHVTDQDGAITTDRPVSAGDFIVPAGAECRAGTVLLQAGTRLDFRHLAALATVGCGEVPVFTQPEVAILATGDEIVGISKQPLPHQIRNSNSHTLAAQVQSAGGIPRVLPVARDEYTATRELIREGLSSDLLLLSGGVSAGKYDIVEKVLADMGAEFFFDRVLIQPGQPVVFGRVENRLFFGLPGNPASTMVTFEIFARAAVDLIAGCNESPLPMLFGRLRSEFRHKPGLTRFLPALLAPSGGEIQPVGWQGSGDVFAVARSNAFVVAREDREFWPAGDLIEVLPR